jgi:hypothetical protein
VIFPNPCRPTLRTIPVSRRTHFTAYAMTRLIPIVFVIPAKHVHRLL